MVIRELDQQRSVAAIRFPIDVVWLDPAARPSASDEKKYAAGINRSQRRLIDHLEERREVTLYSFGIHQLFKKPHQCDVAVDHSLVRASSPRFRVSTCL